MSHLSNNLYIISILLSPVLVETPKKVFAQLGLDEKLFDFNNLKTYGVVGGQKVNKGEPLFPRLDFDTEVTYIKSLMNNK